MCLKEKKAKLATIKNQLNNAIIAGSIDEINSLRGDVRKLECEISDDIMHSKNKQKWFYNR